MLRAVVPQVYVWLQRPGQIEVGLIDFLPRLQLRAPLILQGRPGGLRWQRLVTLLVRIDRLLRLVQIEAGLACFFPGLRLTAVQIRQDHRRQYLQTAHLYRKRACQVEKWVALLVQTDRPTISYVGCALPAKLT